jgi:hypothetical protein
LLGLALISALFAAMFACASTLIAPCGQYAVSMIVLVPLRRLPWRLTRFLGDMHDVGILRRSGMGYEFRHERLREALVSGRVVERKRRRSRRRAQRPDSRSGPDASETALTVPVDR